MKCGEIYSKLTKSLLEKVLGVKLNTFSYIIVRIYFKLFGYPDLAEHIKYKALSNIINLSSAVDLLYIESGNGIYINQYSYYYHCKAIGLEENKDKGKISSLIAKEPNLQTKFMKTNLRNVQMQKKFDRIISMEKAEYLLSNNKLFQKLIKTLKPGGILIMFLPRYPSLRSNNIRKESRNLPREYTVNVLIGIAYEYELKLILVKPCFLFFMKFALRTQQWIFKNVHPFYNLISYPFLLVLAGFDDIIPIYSSAKEIVVVFEK